MKIKYKGRWLVWYHETIQACNLDCSVLIIEIPTQEKWLGWEEGPYIALVALLSTLRIKLFLSEPVPFFNSFKYPFNFLEIFFTLGRNKVDAFKIIRNTWHTWWLYWTKVYWPLYPRTGREGIDYLTVKV